MRGFRYKNNIYSVQFHPELDLQGLIYRSQLYPEYTKNTAAETKIKEIFKEAPYASKALESFIDKYAK